jgi:RHS repeat-associated protein
MTPAGKQFSSFDKTTEECGFPCGVDLERGFLYGQGMPKKAINDDGAGLRQKPSSLLDTRVIYCGDNLEQLKKLPDACIDLIYIDPPFNSNRNYEVFWGETKEKRSFEDRHEGQSLYGYDNASRLANVSDGTNGATYSYLANSSLVGQITFQQSGATRMTTAKQYDYLNRLSSISSTPSNSFAYQYNAANQRIMNQLADGSYWRYGYDALGQVTSGNKYWVDETPVAGQQFDYTFDTIGNRTQTEVGGDQNGANLRVAGYTNNSLNQMTSRGVPGYVDVMGDGLATNGVTVNGLTAYRKNEYFRQQLSVMNTEPVWDEVTVAAPGQTSVTGHAYVAETPENYTNDADGNLLSDGRWNYAWDGENRLVSMTSLLDAPAGSQLQLTFAYDYRGQRIQKMVSTNNGSSYVGEYTNNYVYDGWNCIAILNPSGSLLNSFLWGSDLSGSMQGAGGVGGLIKVLSNGTDPTNCFVACDGNGNVSALIHASDGTALANYEYGPFGELIRASGPMAKLNPFRFSTKYQDDETDLVYYGYRYYNPSTGRWLSRDPITELGFDPSAANRKRHRALVKEDFLQATRGKAVRFKNEDLAKLMDSFYEPDNVDGGNTGQGANALVFAGNDPLDRIDALGLIEYAAATCELEKKLGKGQCRYKCTCPKGYSLGFESSVVNQPCDWGAPTKTCFRLECWDYVKGACTTLVVVGVIILSDGTAIPILACAAP